MLLDTPICDFDWPAPDFTLPDAEGIPHRMSDYLGNNGLLIAFICNHCPYVKRIANQFAADTKVLLDEGIQVLAVMSNDYQAYPADSPPKMKTFAQENGFQFPYLVDENQDVARTYGAVCTPDFFGLNQNGLLQYRGRFDDVGMSGKTDRTADLLNAMRQIAESGKGPAQQIPSMGCSIKWRNS